MSTQQIVTECRLCARAPGAPGFHLILALEDLGALQPQCSITRAVILSRILQDSEKNFSVVSSPSVDSPNQKMKHGEGSSGLGGGLRRLE